MLIWIGLGLIGFLGYVPGLPPELRLLNLFFLVPLLGRLLRSRSQPADPMPAPPVPELPLPPAAGGIGRFMVRLIGSQALALVSPVLWPQMIKQSAGDRQAHKRVVTRADEHQPTVRFRLPFAAPPDGRDWYVFNGGVTRSTSHSWELAGQRFAYDFVIVDEQYRRWRTDGRTPTDYLCYGVPVCAPADGEVVAVRDGLPDAPGVGTGWIDPLARHFPGCTVTIRHAEREYSFFAHLIAGSLRVQVGERVQAGQPIALCGHSGHSTEPHLHFHVQDTADFWSAAGLPIAFDGVEVDGQPAADGVYLVRGQRVRPSAHA